MRSAVALNLLAAVAPVLASQHGQPIGCSDWSSVETTAPTAGMRPGHVAAQEPCGLVRLVARFQCEHRNATKTRVKGVPVCYPHPVRFVPRRDPAIRIADCPARVRYGRSVISRRSTCAATCLARSSSPASTLVAPVWTNSDRIP